MQGIGEWLKYLFLFRVHLWGLLVKRHGFSAENSGIFTHMCALYHYIAQEQATLTPTPVSHSSLGVLQARADAPRLTVELRLKHSMFKILFSQRYIQQGTWGSGHKAHGRAVAHPDGSPTANVLHCKGRSLLYILIEGKDQNSRGFLLNVCYFCTIIKSKIHRSNYDHYNSEIVCAWKSWAPKQGPGQWMGELEGTVPPSKMTCLHVQMPSPPREEGACLRDWLRSEELEC